ncbi:LOW QUALITY PROTEIN: hypothetical protein PHMEG_00018727 [Phytophthora megakarya]|uniref:Uncharacterized protein n=1 Tax=Phytophthora megakarya TaxID=4795 RepID=A0A225VUW4_9STRA|nr:LOW QUALITY PROTEIN: hypothetical protein PHMEG_00018727 [Phytophthora megakarya]
MWEGTPLRKINAALNTVGLSFDITKVSFVHLYGVLPIGADQYPHERMIPEVLNHICEGY